ncbi:replication protein P [Klebsiella pneumoniae]|uniref:replication protein P n=1 Tax=Klebsiella pneumoniae TaxID=573 RepID=UPI000B950F9E|nr:replication protein P [Klebsiella pneumoniae]MCM2592443.1 replication protein P [Klebsiella pneumoniae]MCQ8322385.1 DNA replication protein [Klebsiella pneumoniae]OYM09550.1 DNA replication protein [Klebsiella pneumoniae subsp. pneumoniae]HBR2411217.1 DNA replication protein [Klebsiella pneumoniae]HBR2430620.1 DNA replication protein [Klebsiella pneumoniae]
MRNLVSAIQNRDAGALSRIAGDGPVQVERGVHEGVERLVDALFSNLKQVFPASVSTAWRNPNDEAAAKRQWIAAFAENGIHNKQQLSAGMKLARASGSPFLPSPGQFIEWCKQGEHRAAGLPSDEELYEMFRLFCRDRGLYDCAENYPWESNACFHMVTAVYNQMRSFNLTDGECRKRCGDELRKMTRRIESGEEIPPPRAQLPHLHIPLTNEKGLQKIAELRAKHGLRSKGYGT